MGSAALAPQLADPTQIQRWGLAAGEESGAQAEEGIPLKYWYRTAKHKLQVAGGGEGPGIQLKMHK